MMTLKKIIPVLSIFFIFSVSLVFSAVPTIDETLCVHIPCASLNNSYYEIDLELLDTNRSPSENSFIFTLSSIREIPPCDNCIRIQENTLDIVLPEILFGTQTFALSLDCCLNPPEAIHWELNNIFEVSGSDENRKPAVLNADEDLTTLADGLNGFNMALYNKMKKDGENLFFSPYSISSALAMSYAGAIGETADQIKKVLQCDMASDSLHAGFNYLDSEFKKRENNAIDNEKNGFRLNITNNIWGQQGFPFVSEYLDTLALYYAADLALLDFINDPENSRQIINSWIKDQTQDRIENLIPQGIIDSLTRLVLTNAIYFNAAWASPFESERTEENCLFYISDAETASISLMEQTESFKYAALDGIQAVELPYEGNELSMVIILPDQGAFSDFESKMDNKEINTVINALSIKNVHLKMPAFELTPGNISLNTILQQMGMVLAFSPNADFSGITKAADLFISDVIHKAFIKVDEKGTEAAAATAVVFKETSMPLEPVEMTVNRPFIFFIRDIKTNVILFTGKLVDPS
ncbi:MAG: serpin family protein [Thermodesulfobacteriota bacterium]|nr:serpin family protein [Thermodesulfobacteriota bacterium]